MNTTFTFGQYKIVTENDAFKFNIEKKNIINFQGRAFTFSETATIRDQNGNNIVENENIEVFKNFIIVPQKRIAITKEKIIENVKYYDDRSIIGQNFKAYIINAETFDIFDITNYEPIAEDSLYFSVEKKLIFIEDEKIKVIDLLNNKTYTIRAKDAKNKVLIKRALNGFILITSAEIFIFLQDKNEGRIYKYGKDHILSKDEEQLEHIVAVPEYITINQISFIYEVHHFYIENGQIMTKELRTKSPIPLELSLLHNVSQNRFFVINEYYESTFFDINDDNELEPYQKLFHCKDAVVGIQNGTIIVKVGKNKIEIPTENSKKIIYANTTNSQKYITIYTISSKDDYHSPEIRYYVINKNTLKVEGYDWLLLDNDEYLPHQHTFVKAMNDDSVAVVYTSFKNKTLKPKLEFAKIADKARTVVPLAEVSFNENFIFFRKQKNSYVQFLNFKNGNIKELKTKGNLLQQFHNSDNYQTIIENKKVLIYNEEGNLETFFTDEVADEILEEIGNTQLIKVLKTKLGLYVFTFKTILNTLRIQIFQNNKKKHLILFTTRDPEIDLKERNVIDELVEIIKNFIEENKNKIEPKQIIKNNETVFTLF